jgi:hypothetical protein
VNEGVAVVVGRVVIVGAGAVDVGSSLVVVVVIRVVAVWSGVVVTVVLIVVVRRHTSTEQDALNTGAFVAMKSYAISVGALKVTVHVKFPGLLLSTVIVEVDSNT